MGEELRGREGMGRGSRNLIGGAQPFSNGTL